MTAATTFSQYMKDNEETLEMYTKAIAKVHGPHHAEIIDVRRVYEKMQDKLKSGAADFSAEFEQLRSLTNDYVAPADTCETTVASYQMLGEADRLHHAG